jgi:hypothetical protein
MATRCQTTHNTINLSIAAHNASFWSGLINVSTELSANEKGGLFE